MRPKPDVEAPATTDSNRCAADLLILATAGSH